MGGVKGRPPCEGVGRNLEDSIVMPLRRGRPPCEGVGRNSITILSQSAIQVALHVRAWVEIQQIIDGMGGVLDVALHVRAWVEIDNCQL